MLILKGKSQKSVLADILMDNTNSICFVYYDQPVIFGSICVDNREYSLENFFECIKEEFEEYSEYDLDTKHYTYLIIYTNEKEEDLKDIIEWIKEYRWRIPCNDILIMCKE
jgi:hypothetical protein